MRRLVQLGDHLINLDDVTHVTASFGDNGSSTEAEKVTVYLRDGAELVFTLGAREVYRFLYEGVPSPHSCCVAGVELVAPGLETMVAQIIDLAKLRVPPEQGGQ